MSYKEIWQVYIRLPPVERRKPIVIVDDKIFTWDQCIREIRKKTIKGRKIQKVLERMIYAARV